MAWCYSNIGKFALAAPHFQKAFELASTVSERERLFIAGSYYDQFKGDLATAYEHEGKFADAIRTMKPCQAKHDLNPQESYHLYKLYLKAGDTRDAQEIKADLLHRLAYADPDYPVLVELRLDENHRVAALVKH